MPLNRLIELRRYTVKRDSFGSELKAWYTLATVWAEKLQVKPSERFIETSAKVVNTSQAKFKILARADVNELMLLIDDDAVTWDIQGISKNDWKYLTLHVGQPRRNWKEPTE